ncbi:hypothetical protein [Lacipirellula sp.]|uniref:hypothetical protein n=1 Tax=Lacipirellula sp. TaxID=2691419 RepID=UPI003D0A7E24
MFDPQSSVVDVEFECIPLRTIGRTDIPMDASPAQRRRAEHMQSAINSYGVERTYFLQNARCVFRFANSDVEGSCRFEFEGVARTDAGDRKCDEVTLETTLVSETCGGVPPAVQAWLVERVHRAVLVEFDRFIAAGQLAARAAEADAPTKLDGVGGMDV